MYYEDFLQWCVDTSREDRPRFVRELPSKVEALLKQRASERRKVITIPHRPSELAEATKSAKLRLTNGASAAS
jgi:hypothetical protein